MDTMKKKIKFDDPRLILISWLPFFLIFYFLGDGYFYDRIYYVMSGQLITELANGILYEPFNLINTGNAAERPTIGRFMTYYILFSVMAILYISTLRNYCSLLRKDSYYAFIIPLLFITAWSFMVLTHSSILLFQYINTMGMTSKREIGVYFIFLSIIIWIIFTIIMLRSRKDDA